MSIVDNSNMIDQSKDLSLDDDRPESSSWVRKNFNVKEMLGYGIFTIFYTFLSFFCRNVWSSL